jgi:hypothetical protein
LGEGGGDRCSLGAEPRRGKRRPWSLGEPLARGVWDIPVPVALEDVVPDIVIMPMVDSDRACYRLGYGGGFFDRTLIWEASGGIGTPQYENLLIRETPRGLCSRGLAPELRESPVSRGICNHAGESFTHRSVKLFDLFDGKIAFLGRDPKIRSISNGQFVHGKANRLAERLEMPLVRWRLSPCFWNLIGRDPEHISRQIKIDHLG